MRQETVELAVVGCGVSGAIAARAAASQGVSVAVFEEHDKVGVPSHCSGHVGILAFKHFAPSIPDGIIENEIRGALLHPPEGKPLLLRREDPVTWVINRRKFDQHNAMKAQKAGAKLHTNSRVEDFSRAQNGRFQLRISGETEREITCRLVIDASGCGASISKYAGLRRRANRMLVNSAQFSVDNVDDIDEDLVEVYFGQSYAPGFFGWIIPRRDGSAKVGIAAGARANVRECFEKFVRKHPLVSQKLKHSKPLTSTIFHPIPIDGGIGRSYTDGLLVVGDAASQVKPTTGGGIVFGMGCGVIAGETAATALQNGNTSAPYLAEYENRWRRLFGFDLMAMSWLRKILYRLPDHSLNQIFAISRDLRAAEILNKTADIDFQGKTLITLGRNPRLFLTMLSASILSTPSLLGWNMPQRRP